MSLAEKEKDELTLLALNGDEQRQVAYLIAMFVRSGEYDAVGFALRVIECRSSEMFRLVSEALAEEPTRFQPTQSRENILRAYCATFDAASRTEDGSIELRALLERPPTIREVQEQFKRLFPDLKTPAHGIISQMFDRIRLPLKKDKRGAPA